MINSPSQPSVGLPGLMYPDTNKPNRLVEGKSIVTSGLTYAFGGELPSESPSLKYATQAIRMVQTYLKQLESIVIPPFAENMKNLYTAISTLISTQLNKLIALFQTGQFTYNNLVETYRFAMMTKQQVKILQSA